MLPVLVDGLQWDQEGDPDASGCPTEEWCPFNLYRTSGDVAKAAGSWLHNLQTTSKFRDLKAPLSVPHCWAYPDMLEVGMVEEPLNSPELLWNRAHFGGWAVSSSPLILGADLSDAALMAKIAPIITNSEAIAINQAVSIRTHILHRNLISRYHNLMFQGYCTDILRAVSVGRTPGSAYRWGWIRRKVRCG